MIVTELEVVLATRVLAPTVRLLPTFTAPFVLRVLTRARLAWRVFVLELEELIVVVEIEDVLMAEAVKRFVTKVLVVKLEAPREEITPAGAWSIVRALMVPATSRVVAGATLAIPTRPLVTARVVLFAPFVKRSFEFVVSVRITESPATESFAY